MKVLYQKALKPMLFKCDPEHVHDAFVSLGRLGGRVGPLRACIGAAYGYRGGDAEAVVDGLRYRTPVVLAAGFDYNAHLLGVLDAVAFGGVEVGSVTARPCAGNPPPRMKRLIRSQSLLVNKGLRNDGVEVIAGRIKAAKRRPGFVVGVSIARTNDEKAATFARGIDDFCTTLQHLVSQDAGDYYTINISCPNVHGGESFAQAERLRILLDELGKIRHDRPLYAKMPINVSWIEFESLLQVLEGAHFHGIVVGNLNKDYDDLAFRDEGPAAYVGGLSGRPCAALSTELVRLTREKYGKRFTIIGCGGVLSAEDAMEKFRSGAQLVQLITGMIFEGPHLMKAIARAYAEERRIESSRQRRAPGRGARMQET